MTEGSHEYVVQEAWEVVRETFLDARHKGWTQEAWEELRDQALKRPIRSRMAAYSAISQMLVTLQDPYSRFLTPQQFAQLAKYDVTGVGLNIGEEMGEEGGPPRLKVLGIVLGSPSQLAGVRQGDEILAVNGSSVEGKSAFEAASLIQGPKDAPVTIQFRHPSCSSVEEVTLERTVDVKTPVYYRLDRMPSMGNETPEAVGYIRLREFNARAKRDLVTAMRRLKDAGATSYTLDLQDNPGGLVQAGIEIARLFLQHGSTVIYTEGRDPAMARSIMATGQEITTAPLTVLVNNRTASASEIVAAALHDNCRAVLVGGRTFGKGLIQSVYELSDGSGIILTVGKYVTPSHNDIDQNGIEPDFLRLPDGTKALEKLASCKAQLAIPN